MLDLSGNHLINIPSELGQLSSLQTLNLSSNHLISIPPELGQLSSLRMLDLSFNQLSGLPPELGQLSSLQTLDLSFNRWLSGLPPELSQLSSLQKLSLVANLSLNIPPTIKGQDTPAILGYLRASLQVVEHAESKPLPAKKGNIPLSDSIEPISINETSKKGIATNTKVTSPLKIFYCYAREDKDLCDLIDKHLGILKRLGQVVGWYDREIQAGTEWEREIKENLDTASLILLLVSADFIASDYCYGVEMAKALELHQTRRACVLPILLRPVDWRDAPFASLQMLPTGAKPITQWKDQDEALQDVVRGIRNVISSLRPQR
jgi:hypothetical protein